MGPSDGVAPAATPSNPLGILTVGQLREVLANMPADGFVYSHQHDTGRTFAVFQAYPSDDGQHLIVH